MFFDAALTTVNPLGERLFLAVPRVIHPGAGDKPRPNIPTLRRVGTQRPRPHVRGRVLRTLTRMRFAPGRRVRLACRCRFDAVPVTHLHIHTVWGRTDIPDPSPRPPQRARAARTSGVRDQIPAAGVSPTR